VARGVDAVVKKRRQYGRYFLVLILAAWWILGLLGLEGARRPSVPLVVAVVLALLVFRVVSSARRRRGRTESLSRPESETVTLPRSCIVIHLGEAAR